MRCVKYQLEAYQELMNKSNIHLQDTVKVNKYYGRYLQRLQEQGL